MSDIPGWRIQTCRKCGHEWARQAGARWYCARCEWSLASPQKAASPTKLAAQDAIDVYRRQLLAWVSEQEALRSGNGSWARAQRSMLRNFRDQLLKMGPG